MAAQKDNQPDGHEIPKPEQIFQNTENEYQPRTKDVIADELEYYLKVRRKKNRLPAPNDDLTGFCISGGGVRSATLGLGMLQELIENDKLRYFDYMSTVSGGGFIGSCLSSLLSNEHYWFNKAKDKEQPIKAENLRFDAARFGLDKNNSPFYESKEHYEYELLEDTKLTPRQQLFHLRRYGEYLTPHKKFFSWDVRRAVGALTGGIAANLIVFFLVISTAVLFHHTILGLISNNAFMDNLRHAEVAANNENIKAVQASVLADIQQHWGDTAKIYEKYPKQVVKDSLESKIHKFSINQKLITALDSFYAHPRDSQLKVNAFGTAPQPILDSILKDPVTRAKFGGIRTLRASDTIRCLDSLKEDKTWVKRSQSERISIWQEHRFSLQMDIMLSAWEDENWLIKIFFGIGLFVGILLLWYSRRYPYRIAENMEAERKYDPHQSAGNEADSRVKGGIFPRNGGEDMDYHLTRRFRRFTLFVSIAVGPILAFLVTGCLKNYSLVPFNTEFGYMVFLTLPFAFNLGMFVGATISAAWIFLTWAKELVQGRLYRNFYHAIQGGIFIGMIISAIFPLVIILLFGKHALLVYIMVSLVPVGTAYYFTMQSLAGRSGGSSFFNTIAQKLQNPLLNLSIFLFVALAFSAASGGLYATERWLEETVWPNWNYSEAAAFLLAISALLLLLAGFSLNSNDLSLHYFFRDRLSEAYLRTDGRVKRPDEKDAIVRTKELFDVNLRNHDNLKLSDLGKGNYKAPYHLIVGALNLQGSQDLAKKTLKSDHFIFSKYYIGSRTTGYYRTDKYNDGNTKLATAMTISAAAISSGMGPLGFAASNFYMTLFNLRTGYWVYNPAYQHKLNMIQQALDKRKLQLKESPTENLPKIKLTRGEWWALNCGRFPFWFYYLASELSGNLSSKTRRVYVSDGGHTGDNLGLLPLIQRKCRTILIADFEEDKGFSFGSFNHAVRLSKAIYNANIEIDLRPLIPVKKGDAEVYSLKSVVEGTVTYNDGSTAKLVYMKSAMSLMEDEQAHTEPNPTQPPVVGHKKSQVPVFVLNYFKTNPAFPHQPTSDQYFDEAQFEAYRMLGEHIARQAVPMLEF